jgi:hypothetical protein
MNIVTTDGFTFPWSKTMACLNKPAKFPPILTQASSWQVEISDVSSLSQHISEGYPWMPAILKEGAETKSDAACKAVYSLAVDIDNAKQIDLTIQDAIDHPFVSAHAGLIQQSYSSTLERPRFRIVFPLYNPLYSKLNINAAYRYLHSLIPGCDRSCKDPQRIYYGAKGTTADFINITNTLPSDFLEQALAYVKKEDKQQSDKDRYRLNQSRKYLGSNKFLTNEELAYQMITYLPERRAGEGTYDDCFRALAALVHTFGEQKAIEIAESSPLRSKPEDDWNVAKKVQSISSSKPSKSITFGTLIRLAESNGYIAPWTKKTKTHRTKESNAAYNESNSTSIDVDQIDSDDDDERPTAGWKAPMIRNGVLYDKDTQLSNFSLKIIGGLVPPADEPSLNGSCLVEVTQGSTKYKVILSNKDQGSVKDFLTALSRCPGAPLLLFQGDRRQLVSHLGEQASQIANKKFYIANRLGRQPGSGEWVFPEPIPEFQSPDWVYLGRYDQAPPYYEGFKPQSKGSLKTFLLALNGIVTERYFCQLMFLLGWTLAGLNRQEIEKHLHFFPIINCYGTNGTGKSYAAQILAKLTGQRPTSPETYAYLLATLNDAYDYPLFFDDPANSAAAASKFDYADLTRRCFQQNAGGNSVDRHRTAYRPLVVFTNFQLSADLPSQVRVISLEFAKADRPDINGDPRQFNALFEQLSSSFLEFQAIPFDLEKVKNLGESENLDSRTISCISLIRYFTSLINDHFELGVDPETLDNYIFQTIIANQHEAQADLDAFEQLDDFLASEISLDSLYMGPWCMRLITPRKAPQEFVSIAITPLKASLDHSKCTLNYALLRSAVLGLVNNLSESENMNFTNFPVKYPYTRESYRAKVKSESFTFIPETPSPMKSILIPANKLPLVKAALKARELPPDN